MRRILRQKLPRGRFTVTAARSRQMAAVKWQGNRTTEARLRGALAAAGISGWKIAPRDVSGKPDFYFPKRRLAVFVDGCFWHGCRRCGHVPKTNGGFWHAKIVGNRARDRQIRIQLQMSNIRALRFWEHELREGLPRCVARVIAALQCSGKLKDERRSGVTSAY